MLSWQLPNRSTHQTSPTIVPSSSVGQRHQPGHHPDRVDLLAERLERDPGRRGSPAAGARMSRPANVGPGDGEVVLLVGERHRPARRRRSSRPRARAARCRDRGSSRTRSRPRSPAGRCRRPGRRPRARSRRAGTAPRARARARRRGRRAAGMSWVMSTIVSSGARPSMTAWQTPDELVGVPVVGEERDELRRVSGTGRGYVRVAPSALQRIRERRPERAPERGTVRGAEVGARARSWRAERHEVRRPERPGVTGCSAGRGRRRRPRRGRGRTGRLGRRGGRRP